MSKRSEAVAGLRAMPGEDLEDHIAQQRRRLFEVRLQQATGQVENHRELRVLRRQLARALTVRAQEGRAELEAAAATEPEEMEV